VKKGAQNPRKTRTKGAQKAYKTRAKSVKCAHVFARFLGVRGVDFGARGV
jgi:hypothetical protein